MRTLEFVLFALAISSGLAGCGPAPTSSAAADTAARFAAAVAGRDGAAACALLTRRALDSVTGATDQKCEDVVLGLAESAQGATDVQAWGDAARAAVGGDVLFLLRFDDGWRVDAAGCTPAPDGPYDCKVEG